MGNTPLYPTMAGIGSSNPATCKEFCVFGVRTAASSLVEVSYRVNWSEYVIKIKQKIRPEKHHWFFISSYVL